MTETAPFDNSNSNRKVDKRETRRIKTPPFSFRTGTDVTIYVADLQKAEGFFEDVLGFRLVCKSKECLEYDSGALRLYIYCREPAPKLIPTLEVKDLAGASLYLENAGCVLLPQPDGSLYVQDPLGFLFTLVEYPRE